MRVESLRVLVCLFSEEIEIGFTDWYCCNHIPTKLIVLSLLSGREQAQLNPGISSYVPLRLFPGNVTYILGKLISLRREPCKNETLLYQMGVHFKEPPLR